MVGQSPPTPSDDLAFLARGISGLTIMTFEDGLYVPNLHRIRDQAEQMDFEVC